MNDDTIADLKQFIAATVSQEISQHSDELREELGKKIDSLDLKIDSVEERLTKKIDDLSAAVGDALDTSNETAQKQLDNHETRITKLEHKTA